ncbi:MAG: pyridoxal phosphate-dependent aminotransferase [Candidatus Binatia bacterium]
MKLSTRLDVIKPSSTMAVNSRVLELKAEGRSITGFAAGEPDFPTWPHVCEAAREAIRRGDFYYTAVGGTPELKEAIAEKLARDNGLEYSKAEVLASCGGKHVLYNAFQVTLSPGDEVLIPSPYWVSYSDMVALAGGVPRFVQTNEDSGFLLSPAELEEAMGESTRMVILNSPSNPTGAAYSEEAIDALGEVLERQRCWVLCDDVYEFIRYDGVRPRHLVDLRPSLRERTIIANSVSKTYAMTGWRVGYCAAPTEVIRAMSTIQGQMTSNPTAIAQAAAAAALSGPQDQLEPMVAEFKRRRDYVCERINAIEGLSLSVPGGAFYAFVNASGVFELTGARDGDELALKLLDSASVGVVGGNDFGSRAHFRISYATSMEQLETGMDSIEGWLGSL